MDIKEITENELRQFVRQQVSIYGTQKSLAEAKKISSQYLNDVLKNNKPISNNFANAFGFRLVKKYQKIDSRNK